MIFPSSLVLWFISLVHLIVAVTVINTDESGGIDFLSNLNEKSAEIASKLVSAQWAFETNKTEDAKRDLVQVTSKAIKSAKLRFQKVINNFPWRSFSNPDVRRELRLFSEIGMLALPDEDYNQFQKIISDVDIIQQNTTICDYYNKTKCDLHLYPDIQEKLETSQNEAELSYLWAEWRNATEPKFAKLLNSYVKLCNQAAVLNNYGNFREYSLRNLEPHDLREEMITLWDDIKPLYTQIHAYVRRKLRNTYGEKVVPLKGPIPGHLLGNIWSENWLGIAQRMIPFPEQDNFNFTAAMISQGYTAESIRREAEDFLGSMNFSVTPQIWLNASEMSPAKNSDSCRPKIFNFYADGVRIKNCEKVSLKEYLEDIRLLTKAEYMLQYSAQPFVYQTPADPGLEEAINNIMTMSASTFDNLRRLGLFKGEITKEIHLNRLFKLALEKIMSMSFLLVQEFWRWEIYTGKPVEETLNILNDLRERFQGISTFTKELTFDPGGIGSAFSKLSLAHHFLGYFLEFQMYDSLCQMTREFQSENDLNECNLYYNVEAGEALRKIMSLGSSKTLSESLSSVFGLNKTNSKSILKYFEPLMKWLTKENGNEGEYIGWEESKQSEEKEKPLRTRRKRSLEDYQSEMKDDDTYSTSSGEPDRFQRLVYERSKNNLDEAILNKREQKNSGIDQMHEEMCKNPLADKHKQRRKVREWVRRPLYKKRSPKKNSDDNFYEIFGNENKGRDSFREVVRFTSVNKKRETEGQSHDKSKFSRSKKEENTSRKRSPVNKDDDNPASRSYLRVNDETGNRNSKITRRAPKQSRYNSKATPAQSHWLGPINYLSEKEKQSRHFDSKRDISRLLHSFGLSTENDDKDKIKELKKKLKGKK